MRCIRFLVVLVLIWVATPTPSSARMQVKEASADLAAIALAPVELEESGYLLEGGGYIDDATAVGPLLGSLTGIDVDISSSSGLQRSYMHRLILLFDRLDPGSELLADEITLVHQFASVEEANQFAMSLGGTFDATGEVRDLEESVATYRLVVESADSLVSVFMVDRLVILVLSTDLTGSPDEAYHIAAVTATQQSAEQVVAETGIGLSSLALPIDDMKLTTFADLPESHQHYLVANEDWISLVDIADGEGTPSDFGMTGAFESQQIVTLNTGDSFVFQSWIASFEDASSAEEFARALPVSTLPTVMFADQQGRIGEGPFALRGTLDDGQRYSGYRDVVLDGDRVALVAVTGSGNQIVTEAQVRRFTGLQASCLASPEEECAPVSVAEILGEDATTDAEPSETDGSYSDVTFGWSVDYAAAGWEYSSLEAGVILELQHGRNLASIEPVVNRHGDSAQCLLEEVRLLETLEARAYITLGSDVEDEPVAGNEAGHVWAIYTVEPLADERADQEYTIRIDCYALIEGEASLVVHHSAPRDLWEQESAKGDDLRANIDISGVAAATSDGDDAQVRIDDKMIHRIWIPRAA